jgi:hypothetical protein
VFAHAGGAFRFPLSSSLGFEETSACLFGVEVRHESMV